MAVRAKALTREAIFDALWNRQTYATTNCRIYMDFTVCGQPMGSQIEAKGARPLHVYAASEQPIAAIEIVRNGEDSVRAEPNQMEATFDADDDASGPAYYYARVTRADGQMAWSSPVWVEG